MTAVALAKPASPPPPHLVLLPPAAPARAIGYPAGTSREGLIRAQWVEALDLLLNTCLPEEPPRWRLPSGADVWATLDVREANTALVAGVAVRRVAQVLAARQLGRVYGRDVVRRAVRGLEAV